MTSPFIPSSFTYSDAPQGGVVMPMILAGRNPNNIQDTQYASGYLWLSDLVQGGSGNLYFQGGNVAGVPSWTLVANSGGALNTLSDGSTTVSPTGGNIAILGTANQITVTGSGAGHSLSLTLPSSIVTPGSLTTTGSLTVGTNLTVGGTLTITGGVTFSGNVTVGGTLGVTGLTTLAALTQVGTLSLNASGTATTTIGGSTGAITVAVGSGGFQLNGGGNAVDIANDAAANTVVIGSTTASASLTLQSGSGGNTVIAGNAAATITIGSATQTGTITIGASSAGMTTNIATGTGVDTLNLGTGGTGAKTIAIGGTAANVITIGNTQTGGSIAAGNAMTTGTITLGGASMTGNLTVGDSTLGQTVFINSAASNTVANVVNILDGATPGADTTLNIMNGAGTAGTQTVNILATGATRAGAVNIGTGAAAHAITLGQVTSTIAVNGPQTNTLASGAATGLTVNTSAGTGTAISATSSAVTVPDFLSNEGGIKVTPTSVVAGASPQTCNNRFGSVIFSGVSIASGADQAFEIDNSTVTGATTVVAVWWSGATSGSGLSIKSIVNAAGKTTVTMTNATSATMVTSVANITFTFWVMN